MAEYTDTLSDMELFSEIQRATKRLKTLQDEQERRRELRNTSSEGDILALHNVAYPEYTPAERVSKRNVVWPAFREMHRVVLARLRDQDWYRTFRFGKYGESPDASLREYPDMFHVELIMRRPVEDFHIRPDDFEFNDKLDSFLRQAYFEYLNAQPYDVVHGFWEINLRWEAFCLVKKTNGMLCLIQFAHSVNGVSSATTGRAIDEIRELPTDIHTLIKGYIPDGRDETGIHQSALGRVLWHAR